MLLAILVVTLLASTQLRAGQVIHQHFKEKRGFCIEGGDVVETFQRKGMSALMCASKCNSGCGIVMYSLVNQTCVTFRNRIHQSNFGLSKKPGCVVIYKNDAAVFDGWTLVFRAQAGIHYKVVDYWLATARQDDNPLSETFPASCLRFANSSSCKKHFRSHILNTWENIDEVRYSLYKGGMEVSYIVFNGTNTNKQSWFQQNRILSTSWTKIQEEKPFDHFTLYGMNESGSRRSFYIFGPHSGCGTDYALTFILENPIDVCESDWKMQPTPAPILLYSLKPSYDKVKKKGNVCSLSCRVLSCPSSHGLSITGEERKKEPLLEIVRSVEAFSRVPVMLPSGHQAPLPV